MHFGHWAWETICRMFEESPLVGFVTVLGGVVGAIVGGATAGAHMDFEVATAHYGGLIAAGVFVGAVLGKWIALQRESG